MLTRRPRPRRLCAARRSSKPKRNSKAAADRADNCQRARRALATVNSGMRIATVNDKGEREFMDDKALAGERQRLESIIRSDCAPG